MKSAFRLAAAAATLCVAASAQAAAITYTSSAALAAVVSGGAHASFDFDGLDPTLTAPLSFSRNGFGLSLSNGGFDPVISATDISSGQVGAAITIAFTAGKVNALGADLYGVDFGGALLDPTTIDITLSDGTTLSFDATAGDTFRGFLTDGYITSLTINSADPGAYAAIDNLTVGRVPEPGSLALVGLALAGALTLRRRGA